jgi:hypothetical protein
METLLNRDSLKGSLSVFLRALGGRKRLPPTRSLPVPWPEQVIRE